MPEKRTRAFVSGVAIGAAVGTVTSLLFAPRSGRETRERLKKTADELPDRANALSASVQARTRRLSQETRDRWQETLDRLQEAVAAGVDAARQERQRRDRSSWDAETNSRLSESVDNSRSKL